MSNYIDKIFLLSSLKANISININRADFLFDLQINQKIYLIHLNDFYKFGSIEPNSNKHQNIEKIRTNSSNILVKF